MTQLTIDITDELLTKVEELAKILTPPSQMAVLLNVNEAVLINELSRHNSQLRHSFLRGLANTATDIRKNNIDLATAGSPDAIKSCFESMKDMLNELD